MKKSGELRTIVQNSLPEVQRLIQAAEAQIRMGSIPSYANVPKHTSKARNMLQSVPVDLGRIFEDLLRKMVRSSTSAWIEQAKQRILSIGRKMPAVSDTDITTAVTNLISNNGKITSFADWRRATSALERLHQVRKEILELNPDTAEGIDALEEAIEIFFMKSG